MIGFFAAAVALLATVLALVVYPMASRRHRRFREPDEDLVALGRERLEALKQRRDQGELDEDEYAEHKSDLEAQLADDLGAGGTSGSSAERRSGPGPAVAVVIVFVSVLSGLLYLSLGQPRALLPEVRTAADDAGGEHPENVEAMVAQLAQRLEDNPDNPEGWFMLGRSYMMLQQYEQAVDAFSRARELIGPTPEVLVRQASAIAMTRGGSLAGEPSRLVRRALEQQPDHAQGLWMAATAAYQAGRYQQALDYYRRVQPQLSGQARQQVDERVRMLVEQGYGEPGTASAAAPGDASVASLRVDVALDPALQDRAAAGDTVFIFAKAVDGPPMPLAVVKTTVAALPTTVTLDDSRAMTPQLKLSGFDKVVIGARVSASGQPTARPGDLEGESQPVATADAGVVEVTVDRVVPEPE